MIRIQQQPFDAAIELAALAMRSPGAGAIASFVGLVRPASRGAAVDRLELEQYGQFTFSTVEAIGADASARFDLLDLTIVHRVGPLAPGDPIVFVAAAATHRRFAFDAVDYLMDRLKTEAPFGSASMARTDRAGSNRRRATMRRASAGINRCPTPPRPVIIASALCTRRPSRFASPPPRNPSKW